MNRWRRLWFGFSLVLVVLLAATATISATTLRLDRAETEARQRAALEENVRLALWRMDSALAPLLAQESALPASFDDGESLPVTPDGFVVRPGLDRPSQDVVAAEERDPTSFVALRFQFDTAATADAAGGSAAGAREQPRAGADPPERSPRDAGGDRATRLERLAARVPRERLAARLPAGPPRSTTSPEPSRNASAVAALPGPPDEPRKRAAVEFQQRSQSVMMNSAVAQQLNTSRHVSDHAGAMMTPVWTSGELLLARRVNSARGERVQGSLLEWPAMERWLTGLVADLLPEARLEPLERVDAAGEARLLAALPVRLLPGRLPEEADVHGSVVPETLALAWLAVLLAAGAGAALVVGIIRLSQRRAAFVSAVTHELRTPLTTFRIYTEMLADDMVADPETRRQYLKTLCGEALRLSHMVENVLAYARLERGRAPGPPESVRLSDALEPILPRLVERAAAAGMELVVARDAALQLPVRANRSAVEQILINLVDNACKYAHGAADRRIDVSAADEGRYAALRVRDHGPGMPRRRRFAPFRKTAEEAADSAPGIGLGLALSRRLAQQMGGRLDVDHSTNDGACLVLRLGRDKGLPNGEHPLQRH